MLDARRPDSSLALCSPVRHWILTMLNQTEEPSTFSYYRSGLGPPSASSRPGHRAFPISIPLATCHRRYSNNCCLVPAHLRKFTSALPVAGSVHHQGTSYIHIRHGHCQVPNGGSSSCSFTTAHYSGTGPSVINIAIRQQQSLQCFWPQPEQD